MPAFPWGLNTELPGILSDPKKEVINELGAYLKEEQDSIQKKQYELRDPYRTTAHGSGVSQPLIRNDPKADELLQQLDRLKESLQEPSRAVRAMARVALQMPEVDTPVADPQLDGG